MPAPPRSPQAFTLLTAYPVSCLVAAPSPDRTIAIFHSHNPGVGLHVTRQFLIFDTLRQSRLLPWLYYLVIGHEMQGVRDVLSIGIYHIKIPRDLLYGLSPGISDIYGEGSIPGTQYPRFEAAAPR